MKTKVFISNETLPNQQFIDFCAEKNIELTAQSLISFEPLSFQSVLSADVIFFSSPRSFQFYITQAALKNESIAVIGAGTAAYISNLGFTVDFVGSSPGNPAVVAAEFKEWLGNRTVLFPLALRSNESISSKIPGSQKEEVRVYRTVHQKFELKDQAIYVFTSPSNAESFFAHHILPDSAQIIAWGRSTEARIVSHGFSVLATLDSSSIWELEKVLLAHL